MVWIYGGGLIAGESNDYYASKLVTQGDVIVVTFNYRLGGLWILRSTGNRHRASSSSTTTAY
jgi:para-nitrobenzyl esterase